MIKETNLNLKIDKLTIDMGKGEKAHSHNDMQWFKSFNKPPYNIKIYVSRLMTKEEQK